MIKFLEEWKKKLPEAWKNFELRVFESHGFNLLREKYQSLSKLQQTGIRYLCVLSIFAVLAYFPLLWFFSSSVDWKESRERQNISWDLLKMQKQMDSMPFHSSKARLRSKIQSILRKYSDKMPQIKSQKVKWEEGDFFHQTDFSFQVGSLNVRQVARLGTELHGIKQAYLSYFKMEENKKFPKHYDVDFKLSAFTLKKGANLGSKKRKRPRKTSSSRQKGKNPSAIKGIESQPMEDSNVWGGGEEESSLSQDRRLDRRLDRKLDGEKDKKRDRVRDRMMKDRGKDKQRSRWMRDKKRDRGNNRLRGGEKKSTAPIAPFTKGQDIDQTPSIGRMNTRKKEKKPLNLKLKNSVRDRDKDIDKDIDRDIDREIDEARRTRPPIEDDTENLPIIQGR